VAELVEASPSALSLQGELEVTVLFSDMWLPAHPGRDLPQTVQARPDGRRAPKAVRGRAPRRRAALLRAPIHLRRVHRSQQLAEPVGGDPVVGLGDSVPAAAGCACTSFAELFGHDASPGGNPTRLLAPDGDHPNQAGHGLIAATVAAAGYAPLS
jgi:hypothetical protein